MSDIRNLEPKNVFKWFYELNQIPRGSYNEKQVSDWLVKFAKDRNLEVYQDDALNVIIKKPATKGFENSETVILQGHMDMVCVKTDDCKHDFEKDPIHMVIDGEFIRADGTTLGGDDGIAVAYSLAILDSDTIEHPPLEVLITTNEECGMSGAMELKGDHLSGTRLLNLDTENEGEFLVSCSGGSNIDMEFDIKTEKADAPCYELVISGLKGGHSGAEINKQRANAIKVAARILNEVKSDITLASIDGGIKHNAVPSYAKAVFSTDDFVSVKDIMNATAEDIKEEYRVEEPDFKIEINPVKCDKTLTQMLSDNIIDFLMILPDGVQYMSKDIEGLVQTSLNNAIISTSDTEIKLVTSVRSASESSLQEIINRLIVMTSIFGGKYREYDTYPAWQYEEHSKLRDIAVEVFEKMYGKKPLINSIHAGLECGLLKGILPDTDMISFGPDILDAHTPAEHMRIASVQRVWEYLLELLKNLK